MAILKNKYKENKEEMRSKEENIRSLKEERQRLFKIRNTLCIKMDSLQGYLFRRGIRILPIINGEYTAEEDSDEEYRDKWMDYEEDRYEGNGQQEEFQRISVRITDDRGSGGNYNLHDGNFEEGVHNGEDQQKSKKGSTFAEPGRSRSAPGSRRNSVIQ